MDVPKYLVANSGLCSSAVRVLMVLYGSCKWENAHKPFTFSSIESIRQQVGGVSRSTVDRAIRKLTEIKAVKRTRIEGQVGLALAPHPRAKGAIPPEFEELAGGSHGDKRHMGVSLVTHECVTTDAISPDSVSAPSSGCVTSDTPYNIGIKLKNTPLSPQGGSDVRDTSGVSDFGDVASPTIAQPGLFGDAPAKAKARAKPKPRGRPMKPRGALSEDDVERVGAALIAAQMAIGERVGKPATRRGLTVRDREQLKIRLGEGWSVDQVVESFENSGRTGGDDEFKFITKWPFSSGVIDAGYKIQAHEQPKLTAPVRAADGFLVDSSR